MRVFVSHAWEDKGIVAELAKLPPFVKTWVDVHEIAGGEALDPTVMLAIEESHVFVVLLSRNSISRPWVRKELDWALSREKQKDRVFVLPVLIDPAVDLRDCPPEFAALSSRLHIDGSDVSAEGLEATRAALCRALFRWVCDWLDEVEPKGNSSAEFVDRLERDLNEYQSRLFAVKAVLAWPLPTIARADSVAHLIEVKDRYNEFTRAFMPSLVEVDAEIGWRFGRAAQRAFNRLASFLREQVYHGAAFALNDVIESVNSYRELLADDPEALGIAETRRRERVAALEAVMDDLVHRSSEFVEMLRP